MAALAVGHLKLRANKARASNRLATRVAGATARVDAVERAVHRLGLARAKASWVVDKVALEAVRGAHRRAT